MKKENTIATFALEHKLAVSAALELFLRAGVMKQSPSEVLTDLDIAALEKYVRSIGQKPSNRAAQKSRLSLDQMEFLKFHNVPMSKVFDATGLAPPKYKSVMKDLGFLVAFGVTPCEKKKHQLRARSGHCVQCDSKHLAYISRYHEDGYVYIARSNEVNLIKIGSSINPSERLGNLIRCRYGGASDWLMVHTYPTKAAARIECTAQQKLEGYRVRKVYYYDGRELECNELFSCEISIALRVVLDVLPTSNGQ